MAKKRVIIPVHGIMILPQGYSQVWENILQPPEDWEWSEFWWDNINDHEEKKFKWLPKIPRRIYLEIADHLMDAVKYRFGKKEKAIKKFTAFLETHREADEILILAHSLGSVLSFQTLQQLDPILVSKIRLVTFGSPLTSSFERWWLEVEEKDIYPSIWINLYGDFRDFVGGRKLNFANFNSKNDYFFPVPHKETKYLEKAKNLLHQLFF
jgi:hypothetical protein